MVGGTPDFLNLTCMFAPMAMSIPFLKTSLAGTEHIYIQKVLADGAAFFSKEFVAKCEQWFADKHGLPNFFLTKSCTHSLELAAVLLGIKPGDEVILPSYAFVSCGNAFALLGATCVFIDVHPVTMNIDETKIEAAITSKTKAILTLNYASVCCNYEAIRKIADKHGLYIIEDNAHGILAKQGERFTGTFGDISTFSFDHMKNISCGQGGGIAINNPALLEGFFVPYEFGTNRRKFFNKEADRYEWKGIGSNFQLSELNAAMLFAQLEHAEKINGRFVELWNLYHSALAPLEAKGKFGLPNPPQNMKHNGHCFFIKTRSRDERAALITFLQQKGITAQFHYTPLHSSDFGKTAGRFAGTDHHTTTESHKLLRLPLFYGLKDEEVDFVINSIREFYS